MTNGKGNAKRSVLGLGPVAMVLALLACNLFSPATPSPMPSAMAPAGQTATVEPAAQASPTAMTAPEPKAVVFDAGSFRVLSLRGDTIATYPASGLQYVNPGQAQAVGDAVYYLDGQRHIVVKLSAVGVQDLAFTSSPDFMAFAISPDGSRIAWATSKWGQGAPQSQLHLAAIDGSGAKVVAELATNGGLDPNYVLQPYRFLSNGDLLYAWQISGIGGYILFFGYSSLYRYSSSTGQSTVVVAAPASAGGPCWDATDGDASYVVGDCRGSSGVMGMRERQAGTGAEVVFPALSDQGQAGAGAYSPSGAQLAYAVARSNPDNEFGQIAVRPARDQAPKVIASQSPGYFSDIVWVDEERMVVQSYQRDQATVELLLLTGERSTITKGQLVGLMP